MPPTQVVRLSFSKGGGLYVDWEDEGEKKRRKEFNPSEQKKAIGFAWGLRQEERDQPLILLPPNALFALIDPFNDKEWDDGVKMAR